MIQDQPEEKCIECLNFFTPYEVIEKGPMKGSKCEKPDICQDCMAKGWSDAKLSDFQNDPGFKGKISVLSPLTPELQDWEKEWKEIAEKYDLGEKKTLMICGFIKNVQNQTLEAAAEALEKNKAKIDDCNKVFALAQNGCWDRNKKATEWNDTISSMVVTIRSLKK